MLLMNTHVIHFHGEIRNALSGGAMLPIPCPAEYIKKPHPFLIFSQSDDLIRVVDIDSHT